MTRRKRTIAKEKNNIIVILSVFLVIIMCSIFFTYGNTNIIELENASNIVYKQDYEVKISNINKEKYNIEYSVNDKNNYINITDNYKLNLQLNKNTENNIVIKVKNQQNKVLDTLEKKVYEVENYKKQFLDEFSNNGVQVHYINGTREKYELSNKLLINSGARIIRGDFIRIKNKFGDYVFDGYEWVDKLATDNNIKILAMAYQYDVLKEENEMDDYVSFISSIKENFPQIGDIEIMNEANFHYKNKQDIEKYSTLIKKIKDMNFRYTNIYPAGMSTPDGDSQNVITSENFYKYLYEAQGFNYLNNISYHPYANSTKRLNDIIKNHKELNNNYGGFNYLNATEYGVSLVRYPEKEQADELVKQNVTLEKDHKLKILYSFWSMDSNINSQFGLLRNDYTPRPSYYAMKNYYENTNGAEYIGTLNIVEGLEAHVYDKDGKPKIVAWSNNTSKDIPISYEGFTAKDLYGNEIENTDGTLTITTSPVYLDNVEEKYFYQAISNTAIEKYAELEEKFAEQLQKVPEINQQIQSLKGQIEQIGKVENKIEEETAKTLMQRHFQLGNSLINAFQNGRLEIEKVKLSSMLDMLNNIGNSYEDLVTVTATTRNADINQAKDLVNEVENIIQTNSDIEIIYPEKILDFSKDFQEKAEYINGLEEENDIKTGLIVSKNLHSIYLSNWAKEFTNIYIDEYLKNNLIPETYSEKDITNQDVTVTLNIGNDAQIINNNGSNQYTFTENGEFTFEYVRRGRNFRQTVKVDNIDKQSPNIIGVKQGQVYENTVKPIVEDDNLETIRLIQDGRLIENYINKTELTEEGVYRIEAEDKAGNKTIVNFEIIENISKDYIIKEEQIENIQVNTTVEEFRKKLQIESYYTIIRQEQTLNEKSIIQTGDILQLENGTQYPLIVRGDIDKDGKSTIRDLLLLKQHVNEESTLEDIQKIAGNIDLNGKLDARDVVKLRKLILTNNAP